LSYLLDDERRKHQFHLSARREGERILRIKGSNAAIRVNSGASAARCVKRRADW
jgi:hypothetical protein